MTKPMPKGSIGNHCFEVLEEDGTEVDEEEYFQVVLYIHIILVVIKSIIIVINITITIIVINIIIIVINIIILFNKIIASC